MFIEVEARLSSTVYLLFMSLLFILRISFLLDIIEKGLSGLSAF